LPPARRSAMMPEPTTVASRSAVPTASATARRARFTAPPGARHAVRAPRPTSGCAPPPRRGRVEHLQALFLVPLRPRGIGQGPVQSRGRVRKQRAALVRIAAHGDDVVPRLFHQSPEELRAMHRGRVRSLQLATGAAVARGSGASGRQRPEVRRTDELGARGRGGPALEGRRASVPDHEHHPSAFARHDGMRWASGCVSCPSRRFPRSRPRGREPRRERLPGICAPPPRQG
jgi:hypothetical protein